jgi:hypothetical protein
MIMAGKVPPEEISLQQDVEPAVALGTNESEVSLASYLEGWRFYGTIFGSAIFAFTWASRTGANTWIGYI